MIIYSVEIRQQMRIIRIYTAKQSSVHSAIIIIIYSYCISNTQFCHFKQAFKGVDRKSNFDSHDILQGEWQYNENNKSPFVQLRIIICDPLQEKVPLRQMIIFVKLARFKCIYHSSNYCPRRFKFAYKPRRNVLRMRGLRHRIADAARFRVVPITQFQIFSPSWYLFLEQVTYL